MLFYTPLRYTEFPYDKILLLPFRNVNMDSHAKTTITLNLTYFCAIIGINLWRFNHMTDFDIKKNIAKNIAYYRKQNHITQVQLAELLHSKNTTISTWERGFSTPDAETLFRLCEIFHISIRDIFGCDTVTEPGSFLLTEKEKSIISAYRAADTIGKAVVHRVLDLEHL